VQQLQVGQLRTRMLLPHARSLHLPPAEWRVIHSNN
jgi:hypothetical protein